MKKSILIYSLSTALYLVMGTVSVQAEIVDPCLRRAAARRHTAFSVARQVYLSRVASCQTMPSPDRAEQCIGSARMTFELDSQAARARYAKEVRACRPQS